MNIFISTVISGSVMILIAAVFRALFAKRLHKRTFPVLWGIIMLRLLIPVPIGIPVLPSLFDLFTLTEPQKVPDNTVNISKYPGITSSIPAAPVSDIPHIPHIPPEDHTSVISGEIPDISAAASADPSNSVSLITVLTVIWIIGAVLFALYFTITYIRCMKCFSESFPVSGHEYTDKWLSEHKLLRRRITVRSFDGIVSPLTYGIFSPVILFPGNYDQLSEDELNIILTHEYVHIKRFDAAFKLVLTAALCVYWFDPFVWLMYILANRDIEFACDEAVLCRLGSGERQLYARTLVRMEELKNGSAPTAASE